MAAAKPKKKAYSYIRFSREHQSAGDSLRRQLEATRTYCQRNKLDLDESFDLQDLGVSAYKGRNAEKGKLSFFIQACRQGIIAPGSALVLESLDRLSRQSPRKTVSLLTQLLDEHQIEVHLTMVGKVFRPEKDDGVDLIMAVAMAMRSHEESEAKGKRLQEAWASKRKAAGERKALLHPSVPWWLVLTDKRTGLEVTKGLTDDFEITCPPERAAVVQRIFGLVAAGYSSNRVCRELNAEKVPTWRPRARIWLSSRIRDLIRSEGAQGTLLPTEKAKKSGIEYRIPEYYPRVISDEIAAEARSTMARNARAMRGRASASERPENMFRGLLRYKGVWMRHNTGRRGFIDVKTGVKGWHSYYIALDEEMTGRSLWGTSGLQLEPTILAGLIELTPADIAPVPRSGLPVAVGLRSKLTDLETKIANIVVAIESGSFALAKRLVELEKELVFLRTELEEAEEVAAAAAPAVTHSDFKSLKIDLSNPEHRSRTAATLRRMLARIDVGDDASDLPLAKSILNDFMRKIVNQGVHFIKDPIPNTGRRKPVAVLLNFVGGAKRLIVRQEQFAERNQLITLRVE